MTIHFALSKGDRTTSFLVAGSIRPTEGGIGPPASTPVPKFGFGFRLRLRFHSRLPFPTSIQDSDSGVRPSDIPTFVFVFVADAESIPDFRAPISASMSVPISDFTFDGDSVSPPEWRLDVPLGPDFRIDACFRFRIQSRLRLPTFDFRLPISSPTSFPIPASRNPRGSSP